ncbi:MAG: antibiotic biosynthesis monooxygenase [Planctomycetes bacterium]|nr:antibiotic biosynthesis monooxygenase [Planctomycetota bacterium]NOG53490.1 antibiotic biosynthesis monooxygenase [Planctomycetota bacterium]
MITVGMNYNVIPGKQGEFEDKFRGVLSALREADGHVESKMFRDIDDECAYLIVSEWGEQDKFMGFIRSDAFKAVTNWGKDQILAGRPQHTIYKHPDQGAPQH